MKNDQLSRKCLVLFDAIPNENKKRKKKKQNRPR